MRDLSRTIARLESEGLLTLLHKMSDGHLAEIQEYNFSTITTAKRVQKLLYDWLFFHPEIKSRTSLRLINETATLLIMPRCITEKRGRRKLT